MSGHRSYLEDKYGIDFVEDVRTQLNYLRESGVINMFSSASYIRHGFDVSEEDARKLMVLWMDEFCE